MTTATKCRAKNPAACTNPNCPEKRAGVNAFIQDYNAKPAANSPATEKAQIANVAAAYKTWREGDMEDNEGRIDRANAYTAAVNAWACNAPVRISSMSSDTGSEIIPCHLKASHEGDHDPMAKYPWMN
jgi:hypothetical protein